jgi:hypothetical protein
MMKVVFIKRSVPALEVAMTFFGGDARVPVRRA